jgi:predicted nucleotidyltransferase
MGSEETTMGRDEIISRIRKHADAIRAEGATSLYLFGSAARDNMGDQSDVDVFVDYDPATRFSLLNMSGIRLIVMDELGRDVDITTRDSLHPPLKERILAEAVRVL